MGLAGFQPGNQLAKGYGREGFTFEEAQLNKMRALVDKDLRLLEKLYEGKISEKDLRKLVLAQARILKILDKLHASKSEDTRIHDISPALIELIKDARNNSGRLIESSTEE